MINGLYNMPMESKKSKYLLRNNTNQLILNN